MRESPMYQEILEEGRQEGKLEGRQEGIELGISRGVELVARNLLTIGMAPEQIATATGLTIEEVQKLQTTS